MKLYNEFYKSAEMPFSENSKFYVDNSNVFVTFSVRTSANFSEQYQTELIQGILGMFDFKDFSTTNMVTFLVSEALDRIVTQENRNLFVYLITKCMCIKQFCGTMEAKIKLTEKDLHYKKVKLAKLLSAFPKDFISAYVSYIYSAIIDAVKTVLNNCPPNVVEDVCNSGICLMGGASLVTGVEQYFKKALGISIRIEDYTSAIDVLGAGKLLKDNYLLKAFTEV